MRNIIPFHDLKKQYLSLKPEIFTAIKNVCERNAFSGGPFVEEFEKKFAGFCGCKYAIGVNNGTNALHLSMLALNIKRGDEVIVPVNTFIATAWGVSYVGATPVFVDCDPKTWEIDARDIEQKINKKTKAVIGVHLYGQPFDIDGVKKICKQHKIYLVEDCAQAQGAKYKRKHVGTFGEMGCFSFYPGKNLGAYGEAGAVVANKQKYAARIKILRNHGAEIRYHHEEIGYNMRMDGIQGAILNLKLKYLTKWNQRRKEIAKMYHTGIVNRAIVDQFVPEWADPVYHLFVITVHNRGKLRSYLEKHGIVAGLHYPVPCHLQKAYRFLKYKKGDLPQAEYLADHCLSLPMFPEMTDNEVERVITVINRYH